MREDARNRLNPGEGFDDADAFNVRWMPTLRALGSPRGQPVMMPPPGQPDKRDGQGAVNDQTGASVVLCRRRKRRQEVAELVDGVEAVVRAAAGRLVLLDWPPSSPWLHPREMLWRQLRCEVTHGELFASLAAVVQAAHALFDRDNQCTERV